MTEIEKNEEIKNQPDESGNGGILALAEAVLGEPEKAHLSLEETAEELLALASEASLSSPIHRETVQTPLEATDPNRPSTQTDSTPANIPKPITYSSTNGKHVCNNCAVTSTPFWRKFSDGKYYCNACGLYLRTHNAMRPLSLSKNRESRRGKMRPELCGNCGATDTPMWRKAEDGMVVCNACGLYHKLHGQHRRTGSKRSVSENSDESGAAASKTRKLIRSNEFTLVRENSQISSKSSAASGGNAAKYSLDNQYHHQFDPSRVNGNQQNISESPVLPSLNILPVVETQPVDARKLAYLKCSQRRNALLAPKISHDPNHISQNSSSPFLMSSPMPPILTSFINSLASTSPENLTMDQVEHPLQPLLTSIVSQKLKEQKNKYSRKMSSPPILQTTSAATTDNIPNPIPIPIPMQIYQQQQQDNFSQLAEFIQNQQQAIYNQQMIQQAIYNHSNENNSYAYNPQYTAAAADTSGYVNYQHENNVQYQHHINQHQHQHYNNQYIIEQQQHPNLQYSHQNMSIQQQLPQIQFSQMPQIPQYPQDTQQHQQHQEQQQQQTGVYFNEQFPESPIRQLSPFSGIKFDKNLIDLVNMQFWQDSNVPNSNQENSSDHNNNGGPF